MLVHLQPHMYKYEYVLHLVQVVCFGGWADDISAASSVIRCSWSTLSCFIPWSVLLLYLGHYSAVPLSGIYLRPSNPTLFTLHRKHPNTQQKNKEQNPKHGRSDPTNLPSPQRMDRKSPLSSRQHGKIRALPILTYHYQRSTSNILSTHAPATILVPLGILRFADPSTVSFSGTRQLLVSALLS